jgi:N-acetylmuramoyl-L-alanine amidase
MECNMRTAWMALLWAAFPFTSGCDPQSSGPDAETGSDRAAPPTGAAARDSDLRDDRPRGEFDLAADRLGGSLDSSRLPPAAAAADARPGPPAAFPAQPPDPLTAVGTLLPAAGDFARGRVGQHPFALPTWSKHLKDVRIALDPGHGGDAHERGYKRGPTGVREAEINLRLAQYLAEFLRAAGALVLLTRDDDRDVTLDERAQIANRWPADLFISLHHNAMPKKPGTNYSSVWHHGSVDRCLASLDLARYLADGLHDALALDQVTDVPVKSDLLMYPGGFAVLRAAEMPAALCECSFYSNPDEEQRLRDPEYVLREAHGLFLALARYAHAGLPQIRLIEPADGVLALAGPRTLLFELDDGLRGLGLAAADVAGVLGGRTRRRAALAARVARERPGGSCARAVAGRSVERHSRRRTHVSESAEELSAESALLDRNRGLRPGQRTGVPAIRA